MATRSFVSTPFGMAATTQKTKSKKLSGKTIVQILPALNHGGVERGTVEMAEAIINAGGRAVVISNGGLLESKLARIGAEHIQLAVHSKNPFKIMANRRNIKTLLASIRPDLVHIRSRAPAWSALTVAKKLGIPVVTTIHGRFKASSFFKKIYNGVMLKSDHIIAISNYVENLVRQQFPQVSDKMTVIHRGVDIDLFNPQAISPHRIINMSDQLVIPDGVPVVMLPARPTAWKGMDVLINAMGMLKDKSFLLLLVGAGDGSQDLQNDLVRKIERAELMDKARITPSITDMPAAMMLADVVVMPSTTPEPFGRVAVEASAMGCPVVAFNHGGAVESIVHGVTGWLADPVDPASLAEAVDSALSLKKKQRQKLALEARGYIEKKFTSDLMCQSTIATYLKLL